MQNVLRRHAEEMLALGMVALPTAPGDKNPRMLGKGWQHKEQADVRLVWWDGGDVGMFIRTGQVSGWVVLDCDNKQAIELWKRRLGEELWDQLPCSITGKGRHYWFRCSEPWESFTQDIDEEAKAKGALYDLQADGKGVMAPPSLYPGGGGRRYTWSRKPTPDAPTVPEALRRATVVSGAPAPSSGDSQARAGGGGSARSLASVKLLNPPKGDTGRNVWLTEIAGTLIKHIPFDDLVTAILLVADQTLDVPYESTDPGGIAKIVESIRRSDGQNHADEPTADTGWLSRGNGRLLCLTEEGKGDSKTKSVAPWSNFVIDVEGVSVNKAQAQYRVHIEGKYCGSFDATIDASLFGDPRKLNPWLAARRMHVLDTPGDVGSKNESRRLGMYLAAQSVDAAQLFVVDFLGWNDEAGGFVTHDGLVTAGGLQDSLWVPDARISDVEEKQHSYGFERTEEDAIELLNEVLTFHDETVCSVFGAWWAACLIKPQIMAHTAMFPFMAIEAPSESGKTTGFFSMMVQLNGATRLQADLTPPAMRDAMSSNRSGIVWVDDVDDPRKVLELMRQATAEGSKGKKAEDRTRTVYANLVAPVVLSGEGFEAVHNERALKDRAIILPVPSPTGRKSQNGDHSQWEDIVRIKAKYGDRFNQVAGHLLRLALANTDVVDELASLRPSRGRHGDKVAALRVGARLLARMTHDDKHVKRVDEWVGKLEAADGDYLVYHILPTLWRIKDYPRSSHGYQPVFVDEDGIVWFHPETVADMWKNQNRHDARALQLGSPTAIANQLANLEHGESKRKAVAREDGRKVQRRYTPLSEGVSATIITRSGADLRGD